MSLDSVTVIDCPVNAPGPLMRIAGMFVAERLAKEWQRKGHLVFIRACRKHFDKLAVPGTQHLPSDSKEPAGSRVQSATHLVGVELLDETSRQRAEWVVMEECRRPYDGLADKYLWRAVSLRISRVVSKTSITPNQVTAVSTLCGLTSCVCLAVGGTARWSLWIAAIAIVIAIVLDSVDGELARVRHMGSKFGMWFDNLSDDVIDSTIIACMGMAIGGVWVPIAFVVTAMRVFAAAVIYHGAAILGHSGDVMAFRWWFESTRETTEVYRGRISLLLLLRSFGRRDMYITIFAVFFALGSPLPALILAISNTLSHFGLAIAHLLFSVSPKGI